MRAGVAVVLVAGLASRASALDTLKCAVCHKAFDKLSRVLNETKAELELSKEYNDKKAMKVDKVQKAQTKRWLKNEYGVALRALPAEGAIRALGGAPRASLLALVPPERKLGALWAETLAAGAGGPAD